MENQKNINPSQQMWEGNCDLWESVVIEDMVRQFDGLIP